MQKLLAKHSLIDYSFALVHYPVSHRFYRRSGYDGFWSWSCLMLASLSEYTLDGVTKWMIMVRYYISDGRSVHLSRWNRLTPVILCSLLWPSEMVSVPIVSFRNEDFACCRIDLVARCELLKVLQCPFEAWNTHPSIWRCGPQYLCWNANSIFLIPRSYGPLIKVLENVRNKLLQVE